MSGRLSIVGIGPGDVSHMTERARKAIHASDVIVSYEGYLGPLEDLITGKEVLSSGMMEEVRRAGTAIEKSLDGLDVAVISSGDPGVYAMACIVLEVLKKRGVTADVEIIPGVTSAVACAALLGAPLGHDFAVISLSDLLTPWEVIEKRIVCAAQADFVIVLYNPKSKKRKWQLKHVVSAILKHRSPATPVGIVRNASKENETARITTLEDIPYDEVDMMSTVIIGNSKTTVYERWMITPRGYSEKYDLEVMDR